MNATTEFLARAQLESLIPKYEAAIAENAELREALRLAIGTLKDVTNGTAACGRVLVTLDTVLDGYPVRRDG